MTGTIRLGEIAHARSGDKGNHANIGVIAFREEDFRHLGQVLTETRVAEYFLPLRPSEVRRYAVARHSRLQLCVVQRSGRRSQPLAAHRQPGQDARAGSVGNADSRAAAADGADATAGVRNPSQNRLRLHEATSR